MSCEGCGSSDNAETDSAYVLILQRMNELLHSSYLFIVDVLYSQYVHLVGDVLGLDAVLILEYISLIHWPIIFCFVLPIMIVILLYASALFLTIYKWRHQLQEAYHHDFWDGARQTLAVLWETQSTIWHGYEIEGLDNIPDNGAALIIYYHGALPLDMYYMIPKLYLYKHRLLHPVGDRFLFKIPGFQTLMKVFKVEAGTVESCTSLLKAGKIVAIAPGGVREALFSHSYELMWNKRKGFAKVALASQAPVIPVFTMNSRQAFNTLSIGESFYRYIYEKTKFPLAPIYGGFPVKLKTFVGKPIYTQDTSLSAEQLSEQVNAAIVNLINQHQRQPGSILMGLLARFTG